MKFLVMGCGRIGAEVATLLWKQGNLVTVLEKESEGFTRLPLDMQSGNTTLLGDGMVEQDLIRAGIREADVFVAVDVRDNCNALASQKAKHIFHVPQVICRIGDPIKQQIYLELGLSAISPTHATTTLILEAIQSQKKCLC